MRLLVLALLATAALLASCKKADAPLPAGKRYAIEVRPGSPTVLRVTPTSGWKMNLEYPTRLEAKKQPAGTAVEIAKPQAKVTDNEVRVEVPGQPNEAFDGTLYFAICTAKTCIPVEERVRWTVAAAQPQP